MIDTSDAKLLHHLQADARIGSAQLAERAQMSASTCWRKTRALEEAGVIKGYTAVIDPKKVGLNFEAVVQLDLDRHDADAVAALEKTLLACDEVIECLATTGDFDFLLRVICADIEAYNRFMEQNLFQNSGVRSMRTNVVLKKIKTDAPIRPPA